MASIRSSTVPRVMNLCTSTLRRWPMRKARSVAWFSTAGFHQRSKWITCEAPVRLRPVPPALSDRIRNGGPSSRLEAVDHGAPRAHPRAAVQHQPGAAEQGSRRTRPAGR